MTRRPLRLSVLLLLIAASIPAADPPANEPQNPSPDNTVNSTTPTTPQQQAGNMPVNTGVAGTGVIGGGAGVPARDLDRAQTRGNALNPADMAAVDAQVESLRTSLDQMINGFFAVEDALDSSGDLPATIARKNLAENQELLQRTQRMNSATTPASFALVPLPWNYGIVSSADFKPYDERKYPTYPSAYEMENFGAEITQKANAKLQKIQNQLRDIGIGGCGSFDWGTEFTALFNRETLSNMLKNLQEGVIAAAPMAIIQALSPELANIIQHLKAMASAALAVSRGDCSAIQGMMTDNLSKMFNGPKYAACMENAANSGMSSQDANRICADQRSVKETPLFGLEGALQRVQDGGVALHNALGDTAAVVASSGNLSFSQASQMRSNQATAVSGAAQDLADYQAAQGQLQACLAALTPTSTDLERAACKEIEKTALAHREAAYRKLAASSEKTLLDCARNPSAPGCADIMKNVNNGAGSGAGSTFNDQVNTLTGNANSLYQNIKGSNALLSATGGFLEDYFGQMVSRPQLNASFEIGGYSYRFNLAKLEHAQAQISWDIEDKLMEIYRSYRDCTPALADNLLTLEVYLYGIAKKPWLAVQTKSLSPNGPLLSIHKDYYTHSLAMCSRETMVKLAYKYYLSKQAGGSSPYVIAEKAFISYPPSEYGIHEAIQAITAAVVAEYLYHYITTDQKVVRMISDLRTNLGSIQHPDAKATAEKYLDEGFKRIDNIFVPRLDDVVPVLIAINSDPMPPQLCAQAPTTQSELVVPAPSQPASPQYFDELAP
jgi:hypothetical protein